MPLLSDDNETHVLLTHHTYTPSMQPASGFLVDCASTIIFGLLQWILALSPTSMESGLPPTTCEGIACIFYLLFCFAMFVAFYFLLQGLVSRLALCSVVCALDCFPRFFTLLCFCCVPLCSCFGFVCLSHLSFIRHFVYSTCLPSFHFLFSPCVMRLILYAFSSLILVAFWVISLSLFCQCLLLYHHHYYIHLEHIITVLLLHVLLVQPLGELSSATPLFHTASPFLPLNPLALPFFLPLSLVSSFFLFAALSARVWTFPFVFLSFLVSFCILAAAHCCMTFLYLSGGGTYRQDHSLFFFSPSSLFLLLVLSVHFVLFFFIPLRLARIATAASPLLSS